MAPRRWPAASQPNSFTASSHAKAVKTTQTPSRLTARKQAIELTRGFSGVRRSTRRTDNLDRGHHKCLVGRVEILGRVAGEAVIDRRGVAAHRSRAVEMLRTLRTAIAPSSGLGMRHCCALLAGHRIDVLEASGRALLKATIRSRPPAPSRYSPRFRSGGRSRPRDRIRLSSRLLLSASSSLRAAGPCCC